GGCGTAVPQWMHDAYDRAETQAEHDLLSLSIASEQCDGLMAEGVDHLHLYTLNKPDLPIQLCRAIGVEPQPTQIAAVGCA
ncbi:MAG: methylenetetrahydrofolate reductase, partial [Pseudomonadota bacterium]